MRCRSAPGSHLWKVGGGVQVLPTYMYNPGNPLGTWTFGTDQSSIPATPSSTSTHLANPIQFQATLPGFCPKNLSHTYEAYVQDEWRLRRRSR